MVDNPGLSNSQAAQMACILEATARKPGNVHRFADFANATYLDYLLSAAAIAPMMERVAQRGVGRTIYKAVRRTREVTATNTNLGIILLLTPLAAVPMDEPLESGIEAVLANLDREDAAYVYRAIRLAQPGGMGKVEDQDIAQEPTQTLREVMAMAADRDSIARQYANGYSDVFDVGVPALLDGFQSELSPEDAIIRCHLHLMARLPDTLIARKRGKAEAVEGGQRAERLFSLGWPTTEPGKIAIRELDDWLRTVGHQRNPGTTADLVTACLFVALREGAIRLPFERAFSREPPASA